MGASGSAGPRARSALAGRGALPANPTGRSSEERSPAASPEREGARRVPSKTAPKLTPATTFQRSLGPHESLIVGMIRVEAAEVIPGSGSLRFLAGNSRSGPEVFHTNGGETASERNDRRPTLLRADLRRCSRRAAARCSAHPLGQEPPQRGVGGFLRER